MMMALLMGVAPVPSIRRAAFSATTPLPSGASGRMPIGFWVCDAAENETTQMSRIGASNLVGFIDAPISGSVMLNSRRILVEIADGEKLFITIYRLTSGVVF
jgi:hypothetical protein